MFVFNFADSFISRLPDERCIDYNFAIICAAVEISVCNVCVCVEGGFSIAFSYSGFFILSFGIRVLPFLNVFILCQNTFAILSAKSCVCVFLLACANDLLM